MWRIIPIFIIAFLLVGCAAPANEVAYQQITMEEASGRLTEEEGFLLLDVRTVEEFAAGHIPGAVNIPNETIGGEEIPELPEKTQRIYIYCRSGNRSKQAAEKLAALGYSNIVEIGGINSWTGEIVTE